MSFALCNKNVCVCPPACSAASCITQTLHTHSLDRSHKHAVFVQVFIDFSLFFGVYSLSCSGVTWTQRDTNTHTNTHSFFHCAFQCVHMSFIITLVCNIYLCSAVCVCVYVRVCVCVCVCETLRCAVSLTRYFHNTACLKPRGCIQVTPTGLSSGLRKARLVFCIC